MDRYFKVFISSTFNDLREERRRVLEGLLEMNFIPVGMELFPAAPNEPLTVIYDVIDRCDLYVLLIAGKYGSVTRGGRTSFTEAEYDYAVEKRVPVIAFVRDERSIPAGAKFREKPNSQKKRRLEEFRRKVLQDGKLTAKSWKTGDELKGLVSNSASKVKFPEQAGWIRARDIVPRCPYVERFVRKHEPPLLLEGDEQQIDGERAYRLLRHMFANETFERFRALDLALYRWEEATDDDGQTLNVSSEILQDIETALASKRCRDFKRILVAEEADFQKPAGRKIVAMFRRRENEWRKRFRGIEVETRVLVFPKSNKKRDDNQLWTEIASVHDCALFLGGKNSRRPLPEMGIIETGLSRPTQPIPVALSQFKLIGSKEQVEKLDTAFIRLWNRARPLPGAVPGSSK